MLPATEIFESQISHEKKRNWSHEIPLRKYVGPAKSRRGKITDQRTTHEKKFRTYEIPHEETVYTHETPTKAQWHDDTRPTRPTMVRDPQNLVHSLVGCFNNKKF